MKKKKRKYVRKIKLKNESSEKIDENSDNDGYPHQKMIEITEDKMKYLSERLKFAQNLILVLRDELYDIRSVMLEEKD